MSIAAKPHALYARHELAFRTQYAELSERSRQQGQLLPGTPGGLVLKQATGHPYWYRRFYPVPGKQIDEFVAKDGDVDAVDQTRHRIAFAAWAQDQVRALRKLNFQVADKDVARVLVELHNRALFTAGLVVVGTLAYMAWLNELGIRAVAARTQDLDLARRQALKLATPLSFLDTVAATDLQFHPVPGLSPGAPATTLKRPGAEGLRLDVLIPGPELGQVVEIPELHWHAQTIPHFDYLLRSPRQASLLAGGQCVPVNLPAPERLVWHKLYSSTRRIHDPAKAEKDLMQAATLIAVLVESDDWRLAESSSEVPAQILDAASARLPRLRQLLAAHPQALHATEEALGRT